LHPVRNLAAICNFHENSLQFAGFFKDFKFKPSFFNGYPPQKIACGAGRTVAYGHPNQGC
jgi:hypothetical protein